MSSIMCCVKKLWWSVSDTLRLCADTILKNIFYFAPVQDRKVVFINFNGKGFGCNPKYIAQEILDQSLDYDLVWLVQDLDSDFPEGIRKVSYFSAKALYELATAKVIITNVKNDLRLTKKKNQYVIQTWHGSYSAKRLEADAMDTLPRKYLKESKHNSHQTDLFLSNSRVLSECYRSAFWCDCEIMECGFPRNDVLFGDEQQMRKRVRDWFGVDHDTKLALYAPTFRDDGSVDGYGIDYRMVQQILSERGESWKVLIRMHPNVGDCDGLFQFDGDILQATNYPDMQELLMAADVLITDYSSSVFEFAAMKKQIYIFASDVEQYQKMRGLQPAFFEMPYHICRTNEELAEQIRMYDPCSAEQSAEKFMTVFGGVDQGCASKRVVERIQEVISAK